MAIPQSFIQELLARADGPEIVGRHVQLKKTGVISALEVRVYGDVVIGGTIGTTTASYAWPYNLVRAFKLSVNGQSTLIDAQGLEVKVNEPMSNKNLDDRGVADCPLFQRWIGRMAGRQDAPVHQ